MSQFRPVDDNDRKISDSIVTEVAGCGIRMVIRNWTPYAYVTCFHLLNVIRTITISVRGNTKVWVS